MQVTELPNVDPTFSSGADLRGLTAQAITVAQINAARYAAGTANAASLRDFFIAAANAAHVAAGGTGEVGVVPPA